jgi:hypothetical protein
MIRFRTISLPVCILGRYAAAGLLPNRVAIWSAGLSGRKTSRCHPHAMRKSYSCVIHEGRRVAMINSLAGFSGNWSGSDMAIFPPGLWDKTISTLTSQVAELIDEIVPSERKTLGAPRQNQRSENVKVNIPCYL